MGKHHVKNDPSPPKNDPSPPHRSDPSNEEYITVPKKVTFDSLVEFFPPQTQISPVPQGQGAKHCEEPKVVEDEKSALSLRAAKTSERSLFAAAAVA